MESKFVSRALYDGRVLYDGRALNDRLQWIMSFMESCT